MTTKTISRIEDSAADWSAQPLNNLMAPDERLRLLFKSLEYRLYDVQSHNATAGVPATVSAFNRYFDDALSGVTLLSSGNHSTGIAWSTQNGPSDSSYGLVSRTLKPAYITPADYYSWEAIGYLYVTSAGDYLISINSDDLSMLEIDGSVIAQKLAGGPFKQRPPIYPITLSAGRHALRAAMIEFVGLDGISLAWRGPNQALAAGLRYVWYDTSALFARLGAHPTTKEGLDEFFGGVDTTLMGTGIYNDRIAWAQSITTDNPVPKPAYLPADGFSWKVDGYIHIDVVGTYQFFIGGDDAVDLTIDDRTVASHYGGHGYRPPGYADATIITGSMTFDRVGYYSFTARMEEGAGGESINVQWIKPGQTTWSIIPAAHYKQTPTDFTTPPNEQLSGYEYSGSRTSAPLSLGGILEYESSSVTWTEILDGQTIVIESSVDGGATWSVCTNGGPIAGLTVGETLKDVSVLLRQNFSTTNHRQTPQLSSLTVNVVGQDAICKIWEGGVWKSVKLRQWDEVGQVWVTVDPGLL